MLKCYVLQYVLRAIPSKTIPVPARGVGSKSEYFSTAKICLNTDGQVAAAHCDNVYYRNLLAMSGTMFYSIEMVLYSSKKLQMYLLLVECM